MPAEFRNTSEAKSWLLGFSQREVVGEKLAGRTEISHLQYVTLTVGLAERQSELISVQEFPPVVVVRHWIRQIDIGPESKSFALGLGGTLHMLIQFEAKDAGENDLGAKLVEQSDVNVYVGFMCLVGGNILGQWRNVELVGSVAQASGRRIKAIGGFHCRA